MDHLIEAWLAYRTMGGLTMARWIDDMRNGSSDR